MRLTLRPLADGAFKPIHISNSEQAHEKAFALLGLDGFSGYVTRADIQYHDQYHWQGMHSLVAGVFCSYELHRSDYMRPACALDVFWGL
jgi:hypothetical protein